MTRNAAILVAVAGLLLLTWITVAIRYQPIENDLTERVGQALSARAVNGLTIAADGRDLRLSGEISRELSPDYVAEVAGEVSGVRAVDVEGVRVRASMRDPGDPLHARFDNRRIVRLGGNLVNPMDAGACQRTMARLASTAAIHFESGGASPMPKSYPLLNDLAAVAYQCPATRIVIGGHTDNAGDQDANLRLSQARAEAVEQFFHLAGIRRDRIQTIAYGGSRPIAGNTTAEGRAANRRITFDTLPIE